MMEDTTLEKLLDDVESGAVTANQEFKGVTLEEVSLHNTAHDAWIILNGEALDVTKWIPLHPGGEEAIARFLGKDASLEWNMIHTPGTIERNLRFLSKMGPVYSHPSKSDNEGGAKSLIGMLYGLGCCKRRRGLNAKQCKSHKLRHTAGWICPWTRINLVQNNHQKFSSATFWMFADSSFVQKSHSGPWLKQLVDRAVGRPSTSCKMRVPLKKMQNKTCCTSCYSCCGGLTFCSTYQTKLSPTTYLVGPCYML